RVPAGSVMRDHALEPRRCLVEELRSRGRPQRKPREILEHRLLCPIHQWRQAYPQEFGISIAGGLRHDPLMLTATHLHIRDADPGDAEACGRIFYDAFAAIAHRHAFAVEPDSPEFTASFANLMLSLDGIVCVVAEREGAVVGSGFADVRGAIAGIGPVTVDPAHQDAGT